MSKQKVALITGGARGIGRGIALMLAETGATVHVTDRESRHHKHSSLPGTVEDTAEEGTARGGICIAHVVDHTDDASIAEVFARVGEQHGGLDLVVANAFNGNALPFGPGTFWELPMEHWSHMVDAGLRSHLVTARHSAPLLIERKGLLVLTGYALPTNGSGHVFYDLAMDGISTLGAAAARDLAEHDVVAITVSPGLTRTEAILAAFGDNPLPPGSDTVEHVGRVITALWNDPAANEFSGRTVTIADLAVHYGIIEPGVVPA
jgi:dehydrogenase/reductase SDR family member 1